jgi:hypothetical protein
MTFGKDFGLDCLSRIGFSEMCSEIWWDNIINTGRECLQTCIRMATQDLPLNQEDGRLNACLQCDEDKSGPNYKYFGGRCVFNSNLCQMFCFVYLSHFLRTRRNSGIPTEITRRPEELYELEHCYFYGMETNEVQDEL